MSKAKDLLETVKYMMIENGLDAVPQSLLKSAIDQAIAELKAQEAKSCEGCKYFRNSDKACFKSSQNTYIRPASISFSGCGEFKPKDN